MKPPYPLQYQSADADGLPALLVFNMDLIYLDGVMHCMKPV